MNKFSMKEKVLVSKGVIGIVEQIKEIKMTYMNGSKIETKSTFEYLVRYGEENHKKWYIEGFLRNYLNDEIKVNKVLIDLNLLYDLELAKQLKYETDELEVIKSEAN